MQSKTNFNSNKNNIITVKEIIENANSKNNNNIQSNTVAKSLNLNAKKNQLMSSILKLKKENLDKNNCVNMSNKIILNNKNSINSKDSGVVLHESKKNTIFIKKDVCRIFNSDDFYERTKAKQLHFQEVNNNLNNLKLNSLYSKNLSLKINQSKNIQIDLYTHGDNELDPDKLYNLDFNSNLRNKDKTIIIDDIEELEHESNRYSEKKPNTHLTKEENVFIDGISLLHLLNFI